MADDTDAELILRSWERPERFEVIFDRHFASIHGYLRRRLGESGAEELAAETFARAFGLRRRFDARHASALPWLYGIAANLIRMHRRAEERRLRAYGRAVERDAQPPTGEDDDARLDAAALAPALGEALATLPPAQREVLLLHAWAGLSHAEIAEALGIAPAIVRQRLHRARTHVAGRIERPNGEPLQMGRPR
jgi:RNA polymerase sigma-70 factor, ECF subfamily